MNPWLWAAAGLIPPLLCCCIIAAIGNSANRLVALQLASVFGTFIFMLLGAAESQPSFLDLALTLVLLGFPATLVYAHFLERWL